ncbi:MULTISPECIES: hypothetical protein [Staphylococcus]|uniref:Phage protein n=1 Tax=Staphylococcus condimenti TaxID=70255 RepID=A0AB37H0P7_9STAP|nr:MULTISPECIES: hypothetical protein [Staphylococcus]AMY05088.1 hypothetical protein A4G25_03745 [Staphylococcus condimenti]PNZ59366.1 hypothetical protein CD149_08835 [Staphylococcus condimenti]POA01580.1 hypothetical protein CD153_07760 [Staphylococcus carnosus]QQS83112.1 hypothetical protein I6J05_01955 [Staphylococcus condimenti]QRP94453.1 hypothetical protein I6J35_07070 [Staphylococcus condimenti]
MNKELITIELETWNERIRNDERKNIQINDLLRDNHNKRIEIEDLEVTIEELNRRIEVLEIEEVEELEEI